MKRSLYPVLCVLMIISMLIALAPSAVIADDGGSNPLTYIKRPTNEERQAAAIAAQVARLEAELNGAVTSALVPIPGGVPDYFGIYPNYANSPLPTVDVNGNVVAGTGIRKFVDSLPGLGPSGANNLGQYIPVANADTTTYPGSDYYELAAVQFTEKMHSDLPVTTMRGYVQLNNGTNSGTGLNTVAPAPVHYLGPLIMATSNRPVRIKFTNLLPTTTSGGDLFLPMDTTIMGAGTGPNGGVETYPDNRAVIHLHGGVTPWISDGTPHQWNTPSLQSTSYPQGVSLQDVPDMPIPPGGSVTLFYTNQQSARLMFYHDHALGTTRLNVYDGLAAGYILSDPIEQTLINGGTIPGTAVTVPAGTIPAIQIPLIIQDKTFVPQNTQLTAEDPTWDTTKWGGYGSLWFPHVYMPNQNPFVLSGANAMGRWDYGPWFFPPFTGLINGPVVNPYYTVGGTEPPQIPGTPNPSLTPESFMDTPIVNGTAYPTLTVQPQAYRFRILSAGNDRMLNLSLWKAAPLTIGITKTGSGYTSVPTVAIVGGTVSGAAATASLGVVGFTVGGGAGYTSPPTITISGGGGVGATAVPVMIGGAVSSILVSSSGSGYTSVPTVAISAPPVGGTPAVATAILGVITITVTGGTVNNAVPIINPTITISGGGGGGTVAISSVLSDVTMVPAVNNPAIPFPQDWILPTDGGSVPSDILNNRLGGIPDPRTMGPSWIQIGTEGGFLPAPVVLPPMPVGFQYNPRNIVIGNVTKHSLFLAPAERADVIVDFSAYAGQTLILYNDSPAPVPAPDSRYDYFTGDMDQTLSGGAPSTLPGYGPNTRTIMQIKVAAAAPVVYNQAALDAALPVVFRVDQDPIVVPESAYNAVYGTTYPDNYVKIQDTEFAAPASPQALSSITIMNAGSGYTTVPTVSITGGGGSGATATAALAPAGSVTGFTITSIGSGYVSNPAVAITGGGGIGATAQAVVLNGILAEVRVTAGGSGYTTSPTVTFTGGGGTGAAVTALLGTGVLGAINLTANGTGYTSAPVVLITGGGGTGATAIANLANTITYDMQPKTIQELFTVDYGRMNATLGVELPFTNQTNQTTIPYGYIDPTTEYLQDSITPMSPVAGDGTQIWKITHNGVDTHVIHFHLFNVQVVNRVGWDGAIRAPDANELGWKESVRMSPLEDCIVALRPIAPKLPFGIPDSIRPMSPTQPIGATMGFFNVAPNGTPITVTNQLVNFGWEYVWHCHILGHEENDMMRPINFTFLSSPPAAPVLTLATASGNTLTWTDATPAIPGNLGNPANEIGFRIQRATVIGVVIGPYSVIGTAPANAVSYLDGTAVAGTRYSYIVTAYNTSGTANSNAFGANTTVSVAIPAVPALSLPASGSTVSSVANIPLGWGTIPGATSYHLQILSGATLVVDMDGLITNSWNVPNSLLAAGTYTWQVSATGAGGTSAYSPTFTFTIGTAPSAPVLTAPATGSSVSNTAPIVLTWNASAGATSYTVQVTANGAFSSSINVSGVVATTYTIPAGTLAGGTIYSWQVNAASAGGTSAWSTAFTFITSGSALSTGLLRVQTNPAVPTTIYVNGIPRDGWGLNWVKMPAGSYTLSFSDIPGFATPTQVSVTVAGVGPIVQLLSSPVTITAGAITEVIVNFTLLGNLNVVTSPPVPATIFVNGQPMDDWGSWTYLAAGSYTVSFESLNGLVTPVPIVATVTAGVTTTITGVYTAGANTPVAVQHGLLRVQTVPAVPTTISINGIPREGWGLNWVKMSPGLYTLSFSGIPGFTTPMSVSVSQGGAAAVVQPLTTPITITDGVITVVTVNFIQQSNLRVETIPAAPATIFCDGQPMDDWGCWTYLDAGQHTISFEPLAGLLTPPPLIVTVVAGVTTHVTGDYSTGTSQVVVP
jgi:FtsP/CotA-like multicopper oxidase with cupredoxin domain